MKTLSNAYGTQMAIRSDNPLITIFRNEAAMVQTWETAVKFNADNFRHIVNRRMKWSTVELYVYRAFTNLITMLRGTNSKTEEITKRMDEIIDVIRRACNRRMTYSKVNDDLNNKTQCLIQVALLNR